MKGFIKQQGCRRYSRHYLYHTWRMMNIRCFDPSYTYFKNYGGRGITVCDDWKFDNPKAFKSFIDHMGERPEGMTLDRINPNGDYEPVNCKWSTKLEQQNNLVIQLEDDCGIIKIGKLWVVKAMVNGVCEQFFSHKHKSKCVEFRKFTNLRILTNQQKMGLLKQIKTSPTNKRLIWIKTSKYYGVSWDASRSKWQTCVSYRRSKDSELIVKSLGRFTNEMDAKNAVDEFLRWVIDNGFYKKGLI